MKEIIDISLSVTRRVSRFSSNPSTRTKRSRSKTISMLVERGDSPGITYTWSERPKIQQKPEKKKTADPPSICRQSKSFERDSRPLALKVKQGTGAQPTTAKYCQLMVTDYISAALRAVAHKEICKT